MRRVGQAVAVAVVLGVATSPLKGAAGSGPATGSISAEARGYRLRGYRWDAVLGERWAIFEDAAHPERPLVSELAPQGGKGAGTAVRSGGATNEGPAVLLQAPVKPAAVVVHSGDAVTLWRDEGNVRMQLAAVSEGNAGMGQEVQLRVTGAGIFGSSGWRAAGVVRGPGSVEME